MNEPTTPGGSDRFPGYDVMARYRSWDAATAGVVLDRLGLPPAPRFFSPDEEAIARALLDRLLAQDDEPRVAVFEAIDTRLADGEIDGWRYTDMPDDGEAWRQTLHLLDKDAMDATGGGFAGASRDQQVDILEEIHEADSWYGLPAAHVWSLWMRYACAAFYSHPWAWNEIGFGGPAYPTGYKNLGVDGRESWEVQERDAMDPEPWARRVARARARHRPAKGSS